MRKTNDDYLNNLKTELDKGNNLIDYFLTIGISEEVIFNNFLYENDLATLSSSDLFKPEILTKFPPIEKKNVIVDENIIRHCFPNGFNIFESNEIPKNNSFYFVLDNNHSSIDYPQKFITCLVFYEKLESYKKAYRKFHSDIDLRYSSYHIAKNSRIKRDCSNLDTSTVSEYDIYHTNSTNSNLNNYISGNSNINNNVNFNNFDTESYLNETNQDINYGSNNNINITNNNESFLFQKNANIKSDITENPNNSDNSINNNKISNTNNDPNIKINFINQKPANSKNTSNSGKSSSFFVPTNSNMLNSNFQHLNSADISSSNNPQKEIFNINSKLTNNVIEKSSSFISNPNYLKNKIQSSNINFTTNQTITDTGHSQPYANPFSNGRSNSLRSSYSSINTMSGIKSKLKNIYIPKCICLVSVHPFCNELLNILEAIYSYTSSNTKIKKPLEKIIENLVIEIPLPPRGLYTINYELFDFSLTFKQSKMNELPYISFNLEQIFMHFDIYQTLEIFKHLLLETRMIFFSKDMKILSPIIHGFVTLIYPFKYPFNYITVIPEENFTILENVTPFIIGINQSYSAGFFEKYGIDITEINFLVIDVDNKDIELHCYLTKNKDEAMKKKILKKEFPDLPDHYKNKLHDKIKEYFDQIKSGRKSAVGVHPNKANSNTHNFCTNSNNSNNHNNLGKESGSNFIKTIRNYFYQFMVSIFLNYSKFLNLDYYNNKSMSISIPSVRNLFKVEEFLHSVNASDRPFYSKFILDTQQFADFIYKRMIPKDSKEKLEILLFDEHITSKNNRKYFSKKIATHFLASELYDFKSIYYVEKQRPMNDSEKKFFVDYENRKAALKFGQEILFEKDGEITISYFYFPTLMTDFYFYNNIKNYIIPRNLSEELEQINIEMVSKSHLSVISMKETVMENYIYLCWAQLWAMTFWYHDPEEKRFRFNQLLNVLDRLGQYEIEIFNLLFESINKYGEESMIIELYNKMLLKYKLYPTYSICTIYNRIIDKKNNQKNQMNSSKCREGGVGNNYSSNHNLYNSNTISKNCVIKKIQNPRENEKTYMNTNNSNNDLSKQNVTPHNNITNNVTNIMDLENIQNFRQRSIKSKYDESEISDKYIFLDVYPCVDCQMPIDLYTICRNFKDMNKDLEWALCGNCETKILPKLRIKYLEKPESQENPVFNVRKNSCSSLNSDHYNCDESEVLYSPFHLKYNFYNSSFIESRLKLDINYLKIKFNAIFWNSIWYFRIKDLPYDFISPYAESHIERLKLDKTKLETTGGIKRFDSIQNLISGKNGIGNINLNGTVVKLATENLNDNNKTSDVNLNLINNTSSGLDSRNVKFDEEDIECLIVDKEKEVEEENEKKNTGINVFNKSEENEKNTYNEGTEENANDNFSSLKTFENLVISNNSSDNLENEISKADNYNSNNDEQNIKGMLNFNHSDNDEENKKILNSKGNEIQKTSRKLDQEEYSNLAYKFSDSYEINKPNSKIPGLDGLIEKNKLQNQNSSNNHYSQKSSENFNYSNPNLFLNLKSESFKNTNNEIDRNYQNDFNNYTIDPNKSLSNNLTNRDNIKKVFRLDDVNEILKNRSSAEMKKYSHDFNLYKTETLDKITKNINYPTESNHIANNKYGSNISISKEVENTSENGNGNNIKNTYKNNIVNTNFNLPFNKINKLNLEDKSIQGNEEKINICSQRFENFNIKSYDTCKHMHRKTGSLLDMTEIDKLQQFYNFNLNEETTFSACKNIGPLSPQEKQSFKFNLNMDNKKSNENFYKKFTKNNTIGTIQYTTESDFKLRLIPPLTPKEKLSTGDYEYNHIYSQTSRNTTNEKNFGNILVNLEKEKNEFEKGFETNIDLESLKRPNKVKSNHSSNKDLTIVDMNYSNIVLNAHDLKAYTLLKTDSLNEQSLNLQGSLKPIPNDRHDYINFDGSALSQKEHRSFGKNQIINDSCLNSININNLNNFEYNCRDNNELKNLNILALSEIKNKKEYSKNEFNSSRKGNSSIIDKGETIILDNYKKLSFNLNIQSINSDNNIANHTSLTSRNKQSSYNNFNFSIDEIQNKNFLKNSSKNLDKSLGDLSSSFTCYESKDIENNNNVDNRLILLQDDLIRNEPNIINENMYKFPPHHESKKPSLTRLGTIIEVIENEKDKDRTFKSNLDIGKMNDPLIDNNVNKIPLQQNSSDDLLSVGEFALTKKLMIEERNNKKDINIENSLDSSRTIKSKIITHSSLNIREVFKDREKLERINLHTKCLTEGMEDDESSDESHIGKKDALNLSRITSKSEKFSNISASGKKRSISESDKDKTPVKFIYEGNNNDSNNRFNSLKEIISNSLPNISED